MSTYDIVVMIITIPIIIVTMKILVLLLIIIKNKKINNKIKKVIWNKLLLNKCFLKGGI